MCSGNDELFVVPRDFRLQREGRGLHWCPLFVPLRRSPFPRVQRSGVHSARRLVVFYLLCPPRAPLLRRRERGGMNPTCRLLSILILCPRGLLSVGYTTRRREHHTPPRSFFSFDSRCPEGFSPGVNDEAVCIHAASFLLSYFLHFYAPFTWGGTYLI